jgi:hypothetical protein
MVLLVSIFHFLDRFLEFLLQALNLLFAFSQSFLSLPNLFFFLVDLLLLLDRALLQRSKLDLEVLIVLLAFFF